MDITDLLIAMTTNKASDLHLSSNYPPMLRINVDVVPFTDTPLTSDQVKLFIYSVMNEAQQSMYEKDLEMDFAIQFHDKARFRVNVYTNIKGCAAAFRLIPNKIQTFDELDIPESIRRFANLKKGLVLVTGKTGSGKTTTLASIIDHINSTMEKHILTIEDPVEFIHKPKKALVSQRELHSSTQSFSRALKSALREDPDVILVGELRDLETIQLALSAAETGHLVFGTLHTNSAAKTIDRIIDVFPGNEKELVRAMLSSSIQGVISQALVKGAKGGRVAVQEVMVGTNAVRNLIREGKTAQIQSMIQVGKKDGMIVLKDRALEMFEAGIITQEVYKELTYTAESQSNS